ncbi:unnamed protein product [Menidia menidia]|uniref:(Atlantic silverside) hypothetical protein n=1 Tax=Menidia menidia TaxID=238744 RepID=A0A8S4ASU8_9TELE|nr:unnamed protein product [Menidia menidia]
MASYLNVFGLHVRRTNLGKFIHKVNTVFYRRTGTDVVGAQVDAASRHASGEKNGCKSLHSLLVERQRQAEKSVLISCQSKTNEKKLLKYLSRHGDIKRHFFYESYGVYAVVEFANKDSVASLLHTVAVPCVSHESIVPFKSRLLSLRNSSLVISSNQSSQIQCLPQTPILMNEVIQRLSKEDTLDRQITSLTEFYQLTEENIRLRFLVCSLLKDIAAAYFPECTVKPFGSSVNGFGKLGCDLDMFLDLDSISGWTTELTKSGLLLEYQMKPANSERAVTQSILSVIGECLDQFGPGCVGVHKILNARCPLVRFSHQPSGFQCDLTANNRVAMKSTELLYVYGKLDPRVQSLVCTVRCWARAHGITSSISGAWITNFSLTIMVLFFLQKRNPPIIPTLDHLQDLAEELLCEFFEFYATFPFNRMSINIRKGQEQNKPEVSPLHIQNPFESSLNISQNVNTTQLKNFVTLCQESSWLLYQSKTMSPKGVAVDSTTTTWGIATLLLPSRVPGIKGHRKRREPASERIKSLLESLKYKTQQKKTKD